MNLAATLSLENRGFLNPLAAGQAAIGAFKSAIGGMVAPLIALAGAGSIAGLAMKSITSAADNEDLTAKLKVLTRDINVARSVLKELNSFADVTPFEPEPVQRAGVALIGAKFAATGLKDVLTDIGDLAAGGMGDLSQNLEEVVSAFGRIKAGQFGEAFEILRRFAISTGDLSAKGLKFDAGGQFKGSAEEAINAVRAVIRERFGGTMAEMAVTTKGLWSTLQGNVTAVFREIGAPLLDPLKGAINSIGTSIAAWAAPAGAAMGKIVNIIQSVGLGETLTMVLQAGFGTAINYAYAGFKALPEALGVGLAGAATGFMHLLGLVLTPDFWKGLGNSLMAIGATFIGFLQRALAGVLDRMSDVPGFGALKDYAQAAREQSSSSFSDAAKFGAAGGYDLANATAPLVNDLAKTGEAMAGVFAREFGNVLDVTGSGEITSKLRDLFSAGLPLDGSLVDPQTNGSSATPATGVSTLGEKSADADRLAKIGIFIGGAGGPALEHAKKTAANTSKLVTHTARIVEKLAGLSFPKPAWS